MDRLAELKSTAAGKQPANGIPSPDSVDSSQPLVDLSNISSISPYKHDFSSQTETLIVEDASTMDQIVDNLKSIANSDKVQKSARLQEVVINGLTSINNSITEAYNSISRAVSTDNLQETIEISTSKSAPSELPTVQVESPSTASPSIVAERVSLPASPSQINPSDILNLTSVEIPEASKAKFSLGGSSSSSSSLLC